jgi:hypothetical protein
MAKRTIGDVYEVVIETRGEVKGLASQVGQVCATQREHGDRIDRLEADRDRRQGAGLVAGWVTKGVWGLVVFVAGIAAKVLWPTQ